MAEAVGERASTLGGDSQDESGLPQVCDFAPAVARWFGAAERIGQNLAHPQAPFAEKSGDLASVPGTHRGRKIADCNGTQPDAAGRKSLISLELLGRNSVPLSPDERLCQISMMAMMAPAGVRSGVAR
jgi:hypothetical protein